MSPPGQTSAIGSWWRLFRASNLPTVWTNVLLGGMLATRGQFDTSVAILIALAMCAGSALYLLGMVANDLIDLRWDTANGNPRPLVTGHISPRAALWAMEGLGALAFGVLVLISFRTTSGLLPAVFFCALAICIALYNILHRKHQRLALLLMAACRVLLVLFAASVFGPLHWAVAVAALGVGLWTAGITALARGEHGGEATMQSWLALFIAAALTPIGVFLLLDDVNAGPLFGGLLIIGSAWIPAVARFARQGNRPKAVCWAIMGLCVLDGALLLAADMRGAAAIAMVAMMLCMGLQRLARGT